jgi:MoaA/NifB/PqqE/SkfB family radical SAM enzyme
MSIGRAKTNRHLALPPSSMPELLRVLPCLAQRPGLRPHLTDNPGYCTNDYLELRTIQGGFPRPWLGCRAGLDALGVTSDGRVKGCVALPDQCTEGNVREESLAAIWNDPVDFATTAATRLGNCRGRAPTVNRPRAAGAAVRPPPSPSTGGQTPVCIAFDCAKALPLGNAISRDCVLSIMDARLPFNWQS